MDAEHWIVGPQLIGLILLVMGNIQKRWPPKKINRVYGYRTQSSMKTQQHWDAANRFSARHMIKSGLVLIVTGLLCGIIMGFIGVSDEVWMVVSGVLLVASAIGACVFLIIFTEKHLSNTFDNT